MNTSDAPESTLDVAEVEPFHELVYDRDAWPFIKECWPQAVFADASDFIHEGRFQVEIEGITADDFYPVIIYEGWSGACLAFEMCLLMPEKREDVRRWIDGAKALKEAEA